MGFWDRFSTKASQVSTVIFTGGGEPVWSARDYVAFAREAFQENPIGYQAISKIGDACGAVRWAVWKGDVELEAHPLLDLFARPNGQQSLAEIFQSKVGYTLLSGQSYDERVMVGRDVRELYTHRPDRMKVIPGAADAPAAFVYTVGGRKVRWDVDQITGASDLRQNKKFHPLDDWYGLAAVEPGAKAIDQHNEAAKWLMALLQNSARPSGALVSSGEVGADSFQRLQAQIQDQYSGAQNAGRPMLLEGGLDWKAMGLSPTDMGIVDAANSAARTVSLSFGVPPQMLGIPGDSTYANYEQARLAFWEETVIPLVKFFAADWNSWLRQIYPDVTIKPDWDQIPAIADKRAKMWEMADRSFDMTINERREMKGLESVEGGDRLVIDIQRPAPQPGGIGPDMLKAIAYGPD